MPERSLQGDGVLVTRPEHQAADLIRAVTNAGGVPVSFPVLTIEALPKSTYEQQLDDVAVADIAVFVSANAVTHGLQLISNPLTRIAAVGPATARALRSAGRNVDIVPARGFDSEHLLDEPALRDAQGKRICIVRGEDGRELLASTLRGRGAIVSYLPVYRRSEVQHSPERLAELEADWRNGKISHVVAMSVASLDALFTTLPGYCRESLKHMPIVTPSQRVQQRCTDLGIGKPVIVSDGPQASAIIRALIDCQ